MDWTAECICRLGRQTAVYSVYKDISHVLVDSQPEGTCTTGVTCPFRSPPPKLCGGSLRRWGRCLGRSCRGYLSRWKQEAHPPPASMRAPVGGRPVRGLHPQLGRLSEGCQRCACLPPPSRNAMVGPSPKNPQALHWRWQPKPVLAGQVAGG